MRNLLTALLIVSLAGCACTPPPKESAPRAPRPIECAGYVEVMREDGEGHTLSLRTPAGRVYALAFWSGRMQGTSGAVVAGDPALVSCGESCVEARGRIVGDQCAAALWRDRTRWHVSTL